MALGSRTNSDNKLYILKIVTKDQDDSPVPVHFSVLEKVVKENDEKGKWEQVSTTSQVRGNLTKIEIKEKEFEGTKYEAISLFLEDPEEKEVYLLDLRLNMLTRSLFNSLFNLKDYKDISISLYTQKNKNDGKSYPAASIWQNDELIKWKYGIDELPKVEKVKVGKKTVVDSSELDEFILNNLTVLAENINLSSDRPSRNKRGGVSTENANKRTATKKEEVVENDLEILNNDEDDVPF